MLSSANSFKTLLKEKVISVEEVFSCPEFTPCIKHLLREEIISLEDYRKYRESKDDDAMNEILFELHTTLLPYGIDIKYDLVVDFAEHYPSIIAQLHTRGSASIAGAVSEMCLRDGIEHLKIYLGKSDQIDDVIAKEYEKPLHRVFERLEREVPIVFASESFIKISLSIDGKRIFNIVTVSSENENVRNEQKYYNKNMSDRIYYNHEKNDSISYEKCVSRANSIYLESL